MSPAYGTTAGGRRATRRGGRGGRGVAHRARWARRRDVSHRTRWTPGLPQDAVCAVDRTPTSFYCAPTVRGPVRRDRERSRAEGGSSIAIGGAREHPSL